MRSTAVGKPLVLALIAAFAVYYYLIGSSAPFGFSDEGYLYYLAWIMGEGALPFRDFELSSYPPGLFACYALVFKILGAGVDSGRLLTGLWMITNVVLGYLLTRELAGHRLALVAAVLIGLVPGPWHKAYIGTLCLATLLLAIRMHTRKSAGDFILMGVVIGLGLQFRIDAAIGALVLLPVALWRSMPIPLLARHLALLVVAMGLTLLPLSIYLGTHGVLQDYFLQVLNFPSVAGERSSAWYRLPAPAVTQMLEGGGAALFAWIFYGSLLVPALLLAIVLKSFATKTNAHNSALGSSVLVLVMLWVLMSIPQYLIERPDEGHLYQRGFALVVGACFLVGTNGLSAIFKGPVPGVARISLILMLTLYGYGGMSTAAGGGWAQRSNAASAIQLPNGMKYVGGANSTWGRLALQISGSSRPSDLLAVIPYAPGLNFVLQLRMPGRKVHFFPNAIRNTAEDRATASELRDAKYIVYRPGVRLAPVAGAEFACYSPLTAAMINQEYRSVSGFDDPMLLIRNFDFADMLPNSIQPCENSAAMMRPEYLSIKGDR